ncbi:cell surface protein [Bacillus pfraonensis]|uniref:adhesive domain-containing protein n=1 Tax=Bacillus TaxID=1386 RepID=UPI002A50F826|nr:cell surface protein [Bacillus pseudomycoides]
MRKGVKQLGKLCLVSGIIFTQISPLGVVSTTAYAVTDQEVSTFVIQADKNKAKVDEDIVLKVENFGPQAEKVELRLPDGVNFNEEATKKLNENNKAIESIRLVDHSIIQIQRDSQSKELGKAVLSIKANKPGDFTFVAKVQREGNELRTKAVNLNVLENDKKVLDQKETKQLDNTLKEKKAKLKKEPEEVGKKTNTERLDVHPKEEVSSKVKEKANIEENVEDTSNKEVSNKVDEKAVNGKGLNEKSNEKTVNSQDLDNNSEENPVDSNHITTAEEESNVAKDKNTEIVESESQVDTAPVEYAVGSYQSILKYPGVKVINERTGEGPSIPGKYAFQLRWSPDVSYEVSGTSGTYSAYYRFHNGNANKSAYVLIKNVGVYNGAWMDLRINILSVNGGYIDVYRPTTRGAADNFLRINYHGAKGSSANISYEFLNHKTGKPTPVSSMWNFKRLNSYKSIDLRTDGNYLTNLYTYDTTAIAYQENSDNTSNFVGTVGGEKLNTNMTIIYDEIAELPVRLNLERTVGYLKYDRDAISKVEMPAPDVEGGTTENDSREFYYHIYQNVPSQSSKSYYAKSLSIESEVDKSFKIKNVVVTDEEYNDVSKYFDVAIMGNKIIATAKSNVVGTDQFNDKFYRLKVTGAIVENSDFMKYYKNGYLEIPVSAKNYVDGDKKGQLSNQDIAKVKYKGTPTGKAVPQTVKVGTDLSKMDISKFVTGLSVDTDADIDKPVSVIKLENIPKTDIPGDYSVTAVIRTAQGVEAKIKVPVKVIEGTLKLVDVPRTISFKDLTIQSKLTTYNPTSVNGKVTVADGRANKQKWYVYVKETKPLTSKENDQLVGAMIYTKNGTDYTLNKDNIESFSHTSKDDNDFVVNWAQDEGVRLQVAPGPNVKVNTKYQGELEWTLTDAPI